MEIQNLIREKVVANIKIGTKGKNGIPQKLPYFNVEQDKVTNEDMVEIFKKKYPNKPSKLQIRFTSENPFSCNFKKYVNGKATCIGNGEKAITIGKDEKNNNTQIEVECSENCENRKSGKCKLKGSLKFVLDGIDAGGIWNLNTSGGMSLSNIASEIVKYKRAGMSIVNVPFELVLIEQQSLAYGTYYSIDLHRTDIKPKIIEDNRMELPISNEDSQKLNAEVEQIDNSKEKIDKKDIKQEKDEKQEEKIDFSKVFMVEGIMPTIMKGKKFDKIILINSDNQKQEYVLHPKADQRIISLGKGTVISVTKLTTQMNQEILCKYEIKQIMNPDGTLTEYNEEKLKEAV